MLNVRKFPTRCIAPCVLRAALNGRSIEAEARAILEEAVLPQGRILLGSLLAAVGQRARLATVTKSGRITLESVVSFTGLHTSQATLLISSDSPDFDGL